MLLDCAPTPFPAWQMEGGRISSMIKYHWIIGSVCPNIHQHVRLLFYGICQTIVFILLLHHQSNVQKLFSDFFKDYSKPTVMYLSLTIFILDWSVVVNGLAFIYIGTFYKIDAIQIFYNVPSHPHSHMGGNVVSNLEKHSHSHTDGAASGAPDASTGMGFKLICVEHNRVVVHHHLHRVNIFSFFSIK